MTPPPSTDDVEVAASLQADPSIATVLPCNVVVREVGDSTSVVEAFDPRAMTGFAGDDADADSPLRMVADDARQRLTALLDALG